MKTMKIKSIVGALLVIATFVAFAFIPEASGVITAAAFIVAGSEYHGKENMDIVLRPRFFGTKPQDMGVRIIDSQGASSVKLNFFGKLGHVLMPYLAGFQGGAATAKTQKKLVLSEFKAEAAYDKHDYSSMILEQIVDRGGIKQNDITGTDVFNAELKVFLDAVEGDVFANFWLGDTTKTMTKAGAYPAGTAYAAADPDKYYNNMDGILKHVQDDVYQDSVTKQNLIAGWNTTTYPTLFMANESGTVYAYDTAAHRTAVTTTSRLFSFAGTNGTYPAIKTLTELNSSGITGSIQLEKAASATFDLKYNEWDYIKKLTLATLTTDTAATYFARVFKNSSPELQSLKKQGLLKFYVSDSVLWNYEDTLKSGTLESARGNIVDGVMKYSFNGIPVVSMEIDQHIAADFASTFPKDWIILTTPENLCLVINGSSNFSETRMWFNPDENKNRQRTQFEMGANYILPELLSVAYA